MEQIYHQAKPQIFFSHIHEDADYAKSIKDWLDDHLLGAVVFFVSTDKSSIPLGSEWPKKIRQALENSRIMVVLISSLSVASRWIYFEAGAGYVRGIPVIPICIGGFKKNDLPAPLNFLQAIELPGKESEEQILKIIAESAGLRPPKVFEPLLLPNRPITAPLAPNLPPIEPIKPSIESTIDLSKARVILKSADKQEVKTIEKLVKEFLLSNKIRKWSGNRDDPQGVISDIRTVFTDSILIDSNDVKNMLSETEDAMKSFKTPQGKEKHSGYDHVRSMLPSIMKYVPAPQEYIEKITSFKQELYISVLLRESASIDRDDAWGIIELIVKSDYPRSILPFLSGIIAEKDPGRWDFKKAVHFARLVLVEDFDNWYKSLRGCTYAEDIQREEEKREKNR